MQEYPLVLFDGVCNLCNSGVQFIIKHDRKKQFRFASLQSEMGKRILAQNQLPSDKLDTFIFVDNNKIYTRSTAALRIARKLGGFWKLAYANIIIPRFIRDGIYNFISRNRYKWFGKQEECMVPTPDLRERFVD